MKPVTRLQTTVVLLLSLSAAPWSGAQTIEIPVASQGKALGDVKRPLKGASQQQVIEEFGKPLGGKDPVGEPPITRWDYSQFSVYFEHDRVIHSVMKNQRASE